MRERSYSYSPSPPRGYGRRGRSPSPRGRYRSRGRDLPTSLLIRNLHRDCRREDLRRPFGQFGRLKDIYLPRDYYTGEPRGFGFVQYVDPADASEAKYEMDGQILLGREITVLFAEESRKKPADMRARERFWGRGSDYRSPRYYSHSPRDSRSRSRSRSYYSPSSRQRDYSRGRGYDYKRSPHYYSLSPRYSRSRSRNPSYYSPSPRRWHYSRSVSPEDRRYHGDARGPSPSYYSPSPQRRHYSRSVSPEDRRYHGDARSRSQNPSVSRSPSVEHSARKRSQRGRSISMGD